MTDTTAKHGHHSHHTKKEERMVIVASSTGTVFEWYDFYLYATLAPFFAALFFPKGNETAALLSAFATYAAGFLVRPFGALVFGRLGDMIGRKYTFLVTMLVMGVATVAVGLLPTYDTIGWLAPILLVILRLLQGLALGGEYGGAATYVAEYAPPNQRGYATSWIQTTATIGFFMSLLVIGACRYFLSPADFINWGWRLPFLVSAALLIVSMIIRMRLNESPVFKKMKAEGRASKSPLTDSFLRYPNNKYVLLALLGATMGQGVVWYTGQFYALFFLTITQKVDYVTAYWLIAISLLLGTPFFIFFGALSDRIGRLKIILLGCLVAAGTYFFLFEQLAKAVNPDLYAYQQKTKLSVTADPATCHINIFVGPWSKFGDCDKGGDLLTKAGLSFNIEKGAPGSAAVLQVNDQKVVGYDAYTWSQALVQSGYPMMKATASQVTLNPEQTTKMNGLLAEKKQPDALKLLNDQAAAGNPASKKFGALANVDKVEPAANGTSVVTVTEITNLNADKSKINWPISLSILFIMMIYVTMVYGPIAAFLVELFPAKIRYTSMSLPYHIGNGWFGGMLPLLATAIVLATGNIYSGLWYPVIIALATAIIGFFFLRDTKDVDIHH